MRLQPQITLVNESSERFSNVVTPPPFPSQYSLNSYFVISISETDFVIPEVFQFHDRNKSGVEMTKYFKLIITRDGEVSEELTSLLTCVATSTSQWKKVTRVLKNHSTYEGYQDYIEDEILK